MTSPSPAPHGSTLSTLRRLGPYVRPWRGVLAVGTLAALLSTFAGLAIPFVLQRIVDGSVAGGDRGALPWLALGVAALGLVEAALTYLRRRLIAHPVAAIEVRMRADLYAHVQRLPVSFTDRWQSGQLLSRATSDLSSIRRFLAFAGIYLLVNVVTVVVGVALLALLWWPIGVLVAIMAVPMVLVSLHHEQQYEVASRRAQDQVGELATTVEESVLGIRVLKAFGRGPGLTRRFAAHAAELRGTELTKVRVLSRLWFALIALPELAVAALLAVGGAGVAAERVTVGTVVAAVTVLAYLRWPIDSLGWLLAETGNAASATARYWEVRDEPSTVTDPPRPRPLPEPLHGVVRFEGVRFRHPGADDDLLRGIDLELRPGETLALVGATGTGKTALTALVPRLADVTGGRITLDGVDVRDLALADLRRVVATAFEDPVLFSASVRENVAFGDPGAADERVREALRVAHADGFVDALPWGLDTRIGEQGLSLSGGQRQRLALARAVLGRPAVLVLDDPLSALDVHTEAEVEAALRRVLRDVTALVVAHRPSTVQLADRVALLADGRIAATGTHAELLAASAEYRALVGGSPAPEPAVLR